MSTVEFTHKAIVTPLSDSQTVSELSKRLNMPELAQLQYGTHITTLCFWLSQKMLLSSSDVHAAVQVSSFSATVRRLWCIANESIVYSASVKTPAVYGGNIIMPMKERFTQEEVKIALRLLNEGHPIRAYVARIVDSHYTVNHLDISGLRGLLKLVDFPIYSICALLKCLGFPYVVHNPYLGEDIAIGRVANTETPLCCMYGRTKVKLMDFATFTYLAEQGLLKEPLSVQQALMLGIVTNHTKEN